ncbi:murein hydrolase activator EnvC family protein [Noviherbaspirillum massiliense]|uniref:murein hydrolase activator EnvC family protein n=1 Tax=Noviherbaspirillum massiliense TaxID=1465823 RepID=UPI0003777758|nr:peptidoglycan DD-metalloendopeptidase family protein [Noviherbaspirillum massiliense]
MALALALALPSAQSAKLSERSRQKRDAEAERAELQQKLNALKRDINRTETAKGHAADALAESEAAISDANRALRDLADEQRRTEAKLSRLSREQERLARLVEAQRGQLGRLLREQYAAGNEDRMKLLLSGDNPNRINRELQYLGYASQAQAKLIGSLRTNLQSIEANKADVQGARDELSEIAQEQREQKAQLEKEKARRTVLLSQLSNKLSEQRRQAGNIERDQHRLGALVERLNRLIEEQQKAEAAAREKRRQEQLARMREKAREQESATRRDTPAVAKNPNPDAIDDDEPPARALARNELVPEASVKNARPFKALRGHLHLPVQGELIAKYGSKRGDAPSWKGLFIRAQEGAEVKAVASGRVIFADWLRGFGNLIIVDHGDQYMTIYGNNQAVLKQAGDTVKTGDIIASAGNSGGSEQSGLYFEMRHQGRAFDPLDWVTIR